MDEQELEHALDDLLSRAPEEFVGARDALVRRLKAAGRKEDAAGVKGWRRPTRTVWALNRLAQTDKEAVDALVDAADAVQAASSDGNGMREAMAALRQATRHATDAAVAAIAPARPSDHADVSAGLLAVLAEPDALRSLTKTRLLDIPESGLGAFGSIDPGPSRPDPAEAESAPREARASPRAKPRRSDEAARHKTLDAAVGEARRARTEAAARRERAARATEEADAQRQRAEERVEHARTELHEAEAEAAVAEQTADAARSAAKSAATALEQAEQNLADQKRAAAD